jgi:hypothetical protein
MSNTSTLVADRYRLVEMLHTDAMGIVWQASDERLHRPVGLKIVRVEARIGGAEIQVAIDRSMRAGRRAAELQHPHAVTVLDVVEHERQPCIVTELVESTPLPLVLRERRTLPPSEAAPIGAQVASALEAAHRKRIVHGAVNPGSVLIVPDGSAMIGDFGLAQALGDTAMTSPEGLHNSAYVAPEVAKGRAPRFASDVFSLGAMLYEMVEGTTPFGSDHDADHPHPISRRYPEPEHAGSLAPLLRRMLAVNPKRRPSMASVADSLASLPEDADADAFERLGLVTGTPPIDDLSAILGDFPQRTVRTRPPGGAGAATTDTVTEEFDKGAAAAAAVPVAAAVTEVPEPDAAVPAVVLPADADTEVLQAQTGPPAATSVTDAATQELEPVAVMPAAVPAAHAATEVLEPDQRTRPDLPAPQTRPLPGAAAVAATTATASVPPPRWKGAPPSGPSQRRRRGAGVIAGILILLVALPVGAAWLLDPLPGDIDGAGSPTRGPVLTATPSPNADPSPSTVAPPDPAATPSPPAPPQPGTAPRTPSNIAAPPAPPEAPPQSDPAPPAAEKQTAPPAQSGQGVVDMISGYYALLPGNRDAAWPLMTADYQQYHAGGRSGYDAFWSAIESVEIAGVTATAPDWAQATLTYHFYDGRVVQELTSFRLVDEGGALKIAETAVLSSVQL